MVINLRPHHLGLRCHRPHRIPLPPRRVGYPRQEVAHRIRPDNYRFLSLTLIFASFDLSSDNAAVVINDSDPIPFFFIDLTQALSFLGISVS